MTRRKGMHREVFLIEAARTPQGRRDGVLSGMHSCDLLGIAQTTTLTRAGIDPSQVEQVIAGCINQSGGQSTNIGRTAWLTAGLPLSVAATTIDSQCGSSQQALGIAASLIGSGVIDVALACGVESMSKFPVGSARRAGPGEPITDSYRQRYEWINQFEVAERIAMNWVFKVNCGRAMRGMKGVLSEKSLP
jgi:acetyl-CoA C-acetyltransferase